MTMHQLISRISLGTCLLIWTGSSYGFEVKLDLKGKWTPKQRQIIEQAGNIVFKRIHSISVANCAYRNSFREKTDKLRKRWRDQIPVLNKSESVLLEIDKKDLGKNVKGRALIDIAKIDRRNFKVYNLKITLGEAFLDYSGKNTNPQDLNGWVNTIAHELAHNFGFRHGASGNWDKDYPGFFPTELGYCTMSNGEYGSDQGKQELRRKFRES